MVHHLRRLTFVIAKIKIYKFKRKTEKEENGKQVEKIMEESNKSKFQLIQ